MSAIHKSAYSSILNAIENNSESLNRNLFSDYLEAVNGESIFELTETELMILEFIRNQGRKYKLNLLLSQENPKTGEIIKQFSPQEKITTDLTKFKHTPYQYTVHIS